jgi:alkylation response protein AidB-like acyl-CoA dehydrogenase
MMTTAAATPLQVKGGAFLIEDRLPNEIFTAEDLSEEHLAIARTVDQFWTNEVEPHLEAIRQQTPGVALSVLRKAAELGLAAIPIPEKFGGMEMDLPSVMIAGEHLARDASYGSWHSSHTGIGTLPVLFFGNEEQKRRYLPKLAKVELLAAYANRTAGRLRCSRRAYPGGSERRRQILRPQRTEDVDHQRRRGRPLYRIR